MRVLRTGTQEFETRWQYILGRRQILLDGLGLEVENQISNYRKGREKYLLESIRQFEGLELKEEELWIEWDQIKKSHKILSAESRRAIEHAKERVERFQSELKLPSFQSEQEAGVFWGTEVRSLDRIGIYVPGGKSNYFMTLLLCAVPARMAQVKDILVATPPKKKLGPPYVEPALLYAAKIFEIPRILVAGSVGALAAMSFGTSRTKPVEKIFGSGNHRTAVAKIHLNGFVGTDGMSGPLETAFICDKTSSIKSVSADIIGKADGDAEAEIFIFHADQSWLDKLLNQLAEDLQKIENDEVRRGIQDCLEKNTNLFLVQNIAESFEYANELAPGILCLAIENAHDYLDKVIACGSVLLGNFTPPVGMDLVGGPCGLVTTLGSAAYSVSMSPASFVRRFTVMEFDKSALFRFQREAVRLANEEGFATHEASYQSRF